MIVVFAFSHARVVVLPKVVRGKEENRETKREREREERVSIEKKKKNGETKGRNRAYSRNVRTNAKRTKFEVGKVE